MIIYRPNINGLDAVSVVTINGTANGLSVDSNQVLSLGLSSASTIGALSSTDWSTFNSKQPAGSYVTAVSIVSTNGFAGSSGGGTTPALTLSTTITGVLKGNGTAISAATAGTDYSVGTSALATGILKSTTTTGALTIAVAGDFPTLNQNTTGTASNVTGVVALVNGGTGAAAASANAAFNALSPMTTGGDLIYGGASGTGTRLANGSAGQVLVSQGTTLAPVWGANGGAATGSQFAFTTLTNPTTNVQTNFSNGSQTVTLTGTSTFKWKITLNGYSSHDNVYTGSRMTWALGGTATRQDIFGNGPLNDGIAAQSNNQYFSLVIYGTATNSQTVTIFPNVQCAYTVGNHNFNASYLLEYLP